MATPYPIPVPAWVTDDTTWHEYTSYGYRVNLGAAWAAFALYFGLVTIHTALTVRYAPKVWWMYIPTFTGLAEGLGYLFRVYSVEGALPVWELKYPHSRRTIPPCGGSRTRGYFS